MFGRLVSLFLAVLVAPVDPEPPVGRSIVRVHAGPIWIDRGHVTYRYRFDLQDGSRVTITTRYPQPPDIPLERPDPEDWQARLDAYAAWLRGFWELDEAIRAEARAVALRRPQDRSINEHFQP